MKTFTKITDPIDHLPRWYWSFVDRHLYEKKWHGPFLTEDEAKTDAQRYT